MEYLDLILIVQDEKVITKNFIKSVDTNSYLHFYSSHAKKCKTNIPYSQFYRIKRNCSDPIHCKEQLNVYSERFQKRGYPQELLNNAIAKTEHLNRQELLSYFKKNTKNEDVSLSPRIAVEKKSHRSTEESESIEDDNEGHLVYSTGDRILDRFEIVGNLGEGTFGKVVECLDHDRGSILVALKIIRNERTYREAAEVEINVLKMIRERDQENKYMCVLMQDYFEHHEHVCIVFDLLGKSTYDFQKENHFLPYTLGNIRNMAFQLCHSLNFLKENNLTHTDMKPENIVFVNSDFETSYNEDKKCEEKTIKNSSIRLIDFGSATFDHQYHSTIVATRHYRPPEVILELGWSHPCDIWSLGCILFEYYTGSPLFMTHDDREHLVMMENILGPLPRCMVYKTKKQKYFQNGSIIWDETTPDGRYVSKNCRPLRSYMTEDTPEHREFFDLLEKMLQYDPTLRITPSEALEHPFFNNLSPEERNCVARHLGISEDEENNS
ncbi:dual specificity protein kinase CLK3-like [Mixophyes fleayi]|uniref:dual specificity protein kinase CLK3-like n=1 Tax=Mixophyes fleayi TaxID=3061075 RepID=UPI003F4E0AE0